MTPRDGILITGGSGFLGRALAARLLVTPGVQRVCIYSRGEAAQAAMFDELGAHPKLRMFIGDVRDRRRLEWAMESCDTVIHAAALKRIEVGHYNPTEMVKTNVQGTMNVVEAAIEASVRRVTLVSTDKAYQPVSAYGLTKALAEAIVLAANNTVHAQVGPRFNVCRYGNVAGSTGSVIPKWRAAIAKGQMIHITDPDATRFWMTIDQAVDLVLEATRSHEPLLVPVLPAFRLGDLAEALGAKQVTYGALGEYEKRHESMLDGGNGKYCSATARRMTVDELREALKHV